MKTPNSRVLVLEIEMVDGVNLHLYFLVIPSTERALHWSHIPETESDLQSSNFKMNNTQWTTVPPSYS